ncbi:serine O-acetyltransferase EpsC [Novosphingobium sp. KA1]|uniref:serine O-acetyltransferase EpsC n=1 Tax=Novosphingobium sp. (strain KA1) TaxID=164608 RepID=UPI001A8F65DC|nr:serine O-acetyltransferase EpsC [Novosphingobium sp. KA1]QSR20316.1 serine acetyltransferase [Novosphingobium sp. KA1]
MTTENSAPAAQDTGPEARQDNADFWHVGEIVRELAQIRQHWRATNSPHAEHGVGGFPSRVRLAKVADELCGALFPLRLGPDFVRPHNEETFVTQSLQIALSRLQAQLRLEFAYSGEIGGQDGGPGPGPGERRADEIVLAFSRQLPAIRRQLDRDLEAAYAGDPSARSIDEVLICYPGLLAIIHYRLAHVLHGLGAPLVARILSEIAHGTTGIDIHPAARIGHGFFIDHGTGVVIGETAIVGNNVRIYQGVTLGAKAYPLDGSVAAAKASARHPVVEDDVVIYAGATILGRVTIGKGAEIGGNVWLTHGVPPFSVVRQPRAVVSSGNRNGPADAVN